MGLKLQSEQKEALKHSRWWDPIWRWEQIEQLKDPEKQFDKEALEMAAMLGIEVEEYVRSMSGTAKVSLSSSAYDAMLVMCVRAAQSGDLLGMVHAKEVLSKMEQVGISPDVDLYNQVLSACSAAAGGVMRPCPVRNDTEERRDFIDMAVKVVSYSGGKVDSTEFASRWRTMFPNASIHNYTYTDGKKQSTWKALAQSARFEVEDGEEGKKVIVLRRKDGKDRKKSTTTISSSSSSSSSITTTMSTLPSYLLPPLSSYELILYVCQMLPTLTSLPPSSLSLAPPCRLPSSSRPDVLPTARATEGRI